MLHRYDDKEGGKSYKSVGVRLDLDGKLNFFLSSLSEGEGIGKKNIIEAIFNIVIGDDDFFLKLNPFGEWQPVSVFEGFCSVGVSIQLDAFLNFKMTTLSHKTGTNKKKLLILVLDQFTGNKAILQLVRQRLSIRVK